MASEPIPGTLSLFSTTSAFDQPEREPPPPSDLVQPVEVNAYGEIAALLEEALADMHDDDAILSLLQEALELARKHA